MRYTRDSLEIAVIEALEAAADSAGDVLFPFTDANLNDTPSPTTGVRFEGDADPEDAKGLDLFAVTFFAGETFGPGGRNRASGRVYAVAVHARARAVLIAAYDARHAGTAGHRGRDGLTAGAEIRDDSGVRVILVTITETA